MSKDNLEFSRRELLRNIGLSISLTTAGVSVVSAQDAGHIHGMVMAEKAATPGGAYKPKCFTPHEYTTLTRLSELIMPADERSKSAVEAGAPEFIDLLSSNNEDLAAIYTGGMAWLDEQMQHRYGTAFVDSKPEQQTAMLNLVAYQKNESPELGPGIHFFTWARNMVVDAYFTSKIGMDYLGYMGNSAMSHFSVPEEVVAYAIKHSPFA